MKKDKYLVVGYKKKEATASGEDFDLAAAIRESTVVCDTFSKAYELALFLGGITKPAKAYRGTLEEIKVKGAVEVSQKDYFSINFGDTAPRSMIFKIKSY